MRVRVPKPLHGWRAFAGEVGVIVLGVLIALGAQQVVQALQWRGEVRDFRKAVDHELGRNLETFQVRIDQNPCVARRVGELDRLLTQSRSGRAPTPQRPIGRPAAFSGYFSVWDNKGGEIMDHLPLQQRTRYGELYDELRNDEKVLFNEREVWRSMALAEQTEPLDHADRARLRELLARAEQFNEVARPNYDYALTLARALHVQPVGDPNDTHLASDDSFCQSLLAG